MRHSPQLLASEMIAGFIKHRVAINQLGFFWVNNGIELRFVRSRVVHVHLLVEILQYQCCTVFSKLFKLILIPQWNHSRFRTEGPTHLVLKPYAWKRRNRLALRLIGTAALLIFSSHLIRGFETPHNMHVTSQKYKINISV